MIVVPRPPGVRRSLRDPYLPGLVPVLSQTGAGLHPWAPVTDREAESVGSSNPCPGSSPHRPRKGPGGFAEHLDEVPVLLVLLADLGSRLATVDRDLDRYTLVGGASVYPFAWSILLAARDLGLAGVMTTMVVREEGPGP